MGDYADDEIFAGIDSWRGAGSSRGMNYWPGNYPPQYTHATKRCNRCGLAPLYWEKADGKWRLHAYEGGKYVLHSCARHSTQEGDGLNQLSEGKA